MDYCFFFEGVIPDTAQGLLLTQASFQGKIGEPYVELRIKYRLASCKAYSVPDELVSDLDFDIHIMSKYKTLLFVENIIYLGR